MGFLSRIKNPVTGTAQVVGCEPPPTQFIEAPCRMQLVVQALGVAPFSCEQVLEIPLSKWPSPGATLPVTFDRDHPDRLRVEWDQIVSSGDRARADADALAASQRAQQAAGMPAIQVLGAASSDAAKAAIAKAEARLGIDLDGDGSVAGAPATPGQAGGLNALIAQAMSAAQMGMAAAPAAPAAPDIVGELERLGDLRDRGALTDAEFQAQKQKVLGQS